jgi:hypothetical protein
MLDNIDKEELDILKKLAQRFLTMNDKELAKAMAERELIEVNYDENDN